MTRDRTIDSRVFLLKLEYEHMPFRGGVVRFVDLEFVS